MIAHQTLNQEWFSRKGYLSLFKSISTATASRDLAQGVKEGYLIALSKNTNPNCLFHKCAVFNFINKSIEYG